MADFNIYGVDVGSKSVFVSANKSKGKQYSYKEFLDFDWWQGPGVLITETTTLHPRPELKTPSLAQIFTYGEINDFLDQAEMRDLEVLTYPNRDTWKLVKTFIDMVEQSDPRIADYDTDDLDYKIVKGKIKSDTLEAMVLGFAYEICPQSLSAPSIYDPDKRSFGVKLIKEQIVAETNRRLNKQRILNDYNDSDFSKLKALLPALHQEIQQSNHPGAEVLRGIKAIPIACKRSKDGVYKKGDIRLDELSPSLKAVYAVRVKEDGTLRECGFQMIWSVLGGNAFRFRSGVAGSQLRFNVHSKIRKIRAIEAGLPEPKNKDQHLMFMTRDPECQYYQVQRQCHKDLKNVVKFLNQAYEKLLN